MTTVYVLTTGCHEDRGVSGVFSTPEAAMASYGAEDAQRTVDHFYGEAEADLRKYVWEKNFSGDLTWWDMAYGCAEIWPKELL